MSVAYRLTRSARRDLQEIADFWTAKAGEVSALRVLNRVVETIVILAEQPKAGVAAENFGSGVRKFPAGKYMIYYRAQGMKIDVLHVFHGARDQAKHSVGANQGGPTVECNGLLLTPASSTREADHIRLPRGETAGSACPSPPLSRLGRSRLS